MTNIDIANIRIDGGTQSRVQIDQGAVSDYAEAIKEGKSLPPVVVFFDGANNWLADGFHRWHAFRAAGINSIAADVRHGTQRDAILFSVGANAAHGLRRTNADKHKAVETLLADDEWSKWSDRKIAEACGVGHPLVASVRRQLESDSSDNDADQPRIYITKHGTQAVMRTAGINAERSLKDEPDPENAVTHGEVTPPEHESAAPEDYDEKDHRIDCLIEENDRLQNIASAAVFAGTEEERADLLDRLNRLTEENRQLRILNDGLVAARDKVMRENAQLRRQLQINAKKLRAVA